MLFWNPEGKKSRNDNMFIWFLYPWTPTVTGRRRNLYSQSLQLRHQPPGERFLHLDRLPGSLKGWRAGQTSIKVPQGRLPLNPPIKAFLVRNVEGSHTLLAGDRNLYPLTRRQKSSENVQRTCFPASSIPKDRI